jgi:hypothetical protein
VLICSFFAATESQIHRELGAFALCSSHPVRILILLVSRYSFRNVCAQ